MKTDINHLFKNNLINTVMYNKHFVNYAKIYIRKIYSSDLGRRMARGVFWSFTGTALAKFIILIAGILCAHILGKIQYGEFGMIRSTINMFVVIGSVGLGVTSSKYISEYRSKDKEKVSSIYIITNYFAVILGIIMTIMILVFAPYLALHTLKAAHLANDIRIGSLLLFFTILNGAQNGILAGFEDFKSIAKNILYSGISESLFMLIGAYYYGVSGSILGFGFGFIVLYLTNKISIKKNLKKFGISHNFKDFNIQDAKILYQFSIPAALSSLMVAPVFWYIRSLLVQSNGFGELSLYEVADQWKIIILFIPSAMSQIVLPILSNVLGQGNENAYWKVLKYNIFLNAGITLALTVLIILFSSFIMSLYGKEYNNVWPLIILSVSTIFTSVATVIGSSIASKGKMWFGFLFNLIWAFFVIIFTYVFLKLNIGATAISLSILCAYIILALIQLIYIYNNNSVKK